LRALPRFGPKAALSRVISPRYTTARDELLWV